MRVILENFGCHLCDEGRVRGFALPVRLGSRTSAAGDFWSVLPNWRWLVLLLALMPTTQSSTSVSMHSLCAHSSPKVLHLSPSKSTSLLLEAQNETSTPCRIKLIAPETHSISLLIIRKHSDLDGDLNLVFPEDRAPKCPFIVSLPLDVAEEGLKMSLNLCSEEAIKSVERNAEALPPVVTLEWIPTINSTEEILASEVVVAAVGRGLDICSHPDQFRCANPTYCIERGLVCDGHRNCPYMGNDEDKEVCAMDGSFEKPPPVDHPHMPGWELIEIIKRLSAKDGHLLRKPDHSSHTESTVLVSDDDTSETDGSESLPDVLNHYGPWGYLMLGMLICGTVLMFCGLWECCCRKPKVPAASTAGPTLLIINQGAQQSEMETPPTPGPPRYEDLEDQPPSYSTLFPSSKRAAPDITEVVATNPLPIITPILDSMSNSSSSPMASMQPAQLRGGSGATGEVFTIDLPNTNSPRVGLELGGAK